MFSWVFLGVFVLIGWDDIIIVYIFYEYGYFYLLSFYNVMKVVLLVFFL